MNNLTNKENIIRKLTSRKLWMSLAGFIAGLIIAFGGGETTAATVSCCIMSAASVVGYIVGEGLVDSANAASATTADTTVTTIKKEQ